MLGLVVSPPVVHTRLVLCLMGACGTCLQAGNILVDREGAVKVGDFGVSTTVDRGASWGNDNRSRMTFVGTPCWMAPEVGAGQHASAGGDVL